MDRQFRAIFLKGNKQNLTDLDLDLDLYIFVGWKYAQIVAVP